MQACEKLKCQVHSISPVWNEDSKILILGSFPSVRSRETAFFYGHPQNRFWRVISNVLGESLPSSVEEKKTLLLRNGIALWDVIASCEIVGSSDSSIRNIVPNDITEMLNKSKVQKIFLNGKIAEKLYRKYIFPKTNIEGTVLPSTSPANAAWSFEKLCEAWKVIAKEGEAYV